MKTLEELEGTTAYTVEVETDKDGYVDKECPNQDCLSKFKIHADDWANKVSSEAVYCPFCGNKAPAKSWWTTEQIEQAKEQAVRSVTAKINRAIKADVTDFNRHVPKRGFFKMSMKFSGSTYEPNLPMFALEEMQQKITCDSCGTRYEVIGSAFYCPCCGNNSAKQTFVNSIEKVRAKIKNIPVIRKTIAELSKDEAARTCESLIETSVSDLVVALQRVCECIYTQITNNKKLKRNVFQRLADGSALWKDEIGKGYEDWLSESEYVILKKCFQQRHLLQHREGIVDQDYIEKSGDETYSVGQRIIVKESDVLEYAGIVNKLGQIIISLPSESEVSE